MAVVSAEETGEESFFLVFFASVLAQMFLFFEQDGEELTVVEHLLANLEDVFEYFGIVEGSQP
jgi:hypothetical protein